MIINESNRYSLQLYNTMNCKKIEKFQKLYVN